MPAASSLTPHLLDALHSEALVLADEARFYFEGAGATARATMTPLQRVEFACESLKLTARLTHVLSWLMAQRAGSGRRSGASAPTHAIATEPRTLAALPCEARQLVLAAADLHARVVRMERGLVQPMPRGSPARSLFQRLERAY